MKRHRSIGAILLALGTISASACSTPAASPDAAVETFDTGVDAADSVDAWMRPDVYRAPRDRSEGDQDMTLQGPHGHVIE